MKWKHSPKVVKIESDQYTFDEILEKVRELYKKKHVPAPEFEYWVSVLTEKINHKLGRGRRAV